MGRPYGLSIEIKKLDLRYPKLDMEVLVSFSPFEAGDPFSFEAVLKIHCEDITHPLGCEISFEPTKAEDSISVLIDWDCIRRCAPQCIYCGGDLGCWAACAGGCIIQCL